MDGAWRYPTATMVLCLLLWQGVVTLFTIPTYLVPTPAEVAGRMWTDAAFLSWHSAVTLFTTVGGFVLSVLIGIPLGMMLVWSRVLERSIMPLLVVSQAFPKVAIAPLIVIWFGLGYFPKILIAFSVAFFPVVISTIAGMKSIETDMIDLARSMQGTAWRTFAKIRFPFALPQIFSGIKIAVAFSTVGAVVGEWVGAQSGLGYLLLWSNANLDTPLLFSVLMCLMVIGLALYWAVEALEGATIPWHVSVREDRFGVTP